MMAEGFTRRAALFGLAAAPAAMLPAIAGSEPFSLANMRGSSAGTGPGLMAGAMDDQSRALQSMLDQAARQGNTVFVPAGTYHVANILLPDGARLTGVPGATRFLYAGGGHFFLAENAASLRLSGIVLDAGNREFAEYARAALRISNCRDVAIEDCAILGSSAIGVQIDRSQGRIEKCRISGASGDCGLYALENRDFSIEGNEVSDCANGGILVHRWQSGEDGTLVAGNRIARIGAANGGTGQWGNGINVYRANSVSIQHNRVQDCAFSAIRSNSGSNVQIVGNHCQRSGETAIYSEFEFEGALIANNVVDGAAIGISIANFMQGGRLASCTGNLIRNIVANAPYEIDSQFFGIGISAEADTAISGNVIENAAICGFNLGWGPYLRDVTVNGNVVRDCPNGVIVTVVEGAGPAAIAGNIFSGASRGAIVGHRWMEPATGDLAIDGASRYAHLSIDRNVVS